MANDTSFSHVSSKYTPDLFCQIPVVCDRHACASWLQYGKGPTLEATVPREADERFLRDPKRLAACLAYTAGRSDHARYHFVAPP